MNWVEKDRQLQEGEQNATLKLMKHRYMAVQPESEGGGGYSGREYAKALGLAESTVRGYVNGWKLHLNDSARGVRAQSPNETLERAKVGEKKRAAVDAVATAKGKAFTTVSHRETGAEHKPDIERASQIIDDTIESGGTLEDGAQKARDAIERQEDFARKATESRRKQQDVRRQQHGLNWIEADGLLAKSRAALTKALTLLRDSEFDDEGRDLLASDLASIRALTELASAALNGTVDVDWDAELARLVA